MCSLFLACLFLTVITRTYGQGSSPGLVTRLQPLNSGAPTIPWLQAPSWKPPYADLHNDLEALLKAQASDDRWVTIFCFSVGNRTGTLEEASFQRLVLNTILSYRAFGQASFDIVAAISPAALESCQRFRLPCFNASRYAADARSFKNINWAKIKLARDALKLGYNVHISDLDVSYLKPIQLAIREVFSWSNGAADGSMMQEEWVHQDHQDDPASRRPIYLANTGVIFLRATERSVAFLESMLQWESDQNQEQYMATLVAYQSWAPCSEEATCLAVRHRGMAAITRHPAQFAHSNCEPEPGYDPCASRRLYVHAVCRATSRDKEGYLRFLRAMFVRDVGLGGEGVEAGSKMAAAALSDPGVVGQQDNEAIAASGVPCPARQQRAWRERFYTSYTEVESRGEGGGKGDGGAAAGTLNGGGGSGGKGAAQLRGGGVAMAEAAGGAGTAAAAKAAATARLDASAAALAVQALQQRAVTRHQRPKQQKL